MAVVAKPTQSAERRRKLGEGRSIGLSISHAWLMDQTLLYLINREWARPWLDGPMAVASSWALWWPLLVIGIACVLIFGRFKGRAFILCCGLSILFVDAFTVNSLKKLVGRPRPHSIMPEIRQVDLARTHPRILAIGKPLSVSISTPSIRPVRGGSFPSGHAANNFAIATVMTVFFRRWGWLMYFPAVIVSYSRVYVGVHWPSDILISWFLSIGVTLLVLAGLSWLWRTQMGRFFPNFHQRHPELIPT